MALLENKQATKTQNTPGQTRSSKVANPDWEGGLKQTGGNSRFSSKTTIDKEFAATAFSDRTLGPVGLGSSKTKPPVAEEEEEVFASQAAEQTIDQDRASSQFRTNLTSQDNSRVKKIIKAISPETQLARVRAGAVSLAAISWAGALWLFVQLPFAILGIITLGVMGVIDEVTGTVTSDPSWWQELAATAAEAFTKLTDLFGIDLVQIATDVFLLSSTLTMAVGITTMLVLYLQYTLAFLRPLSGQAMGLKWGMLLLAVIGYSVPLLNLVPFVLGWVIVVWLYPR